jgi:hypothetical protein
MEEIAKVSVELLNKNSRISSRTDVSLRMLRISMVYWISFLLLDLLGDPNHRALRYLAPTRTSENFQTRRERSETPAAAGFRTLLNDLYRSTNLRLHGATRHGDVSPTTGIGRSNGELGAAK